MERPPIEEWEKKIPADTPRGTPTGNLLAYIRHLEGAIDMTVVDGNIGNLMEIWEQIPRES